MSHYDNNQHKSGYTDAQDDQKPALIRTTTGEAYSAAHHFETRDGCIGLYFTSDRSRGIDVKIPVANIETIARTARAQRLLIERYDLSEGDIIQYSDPVPDLDIDVEPLAEDDIEEVLLDSENKIIEVGDTVELSGEDMDCEVIGIDVDNQVVTIERPPEDESQSLFRLFSQEITVEPDDLVTAGGDR